MVRSCAICEGKYESRGSRSFHKFPANPVERKAWCESLGLNLESLSGKEVLCSDHFSIHFFSGRRNKRGVRLLVGARPQKLLSTNIQRQRETENDDDEDDVFSETEEAIQPKRLKREENEPTEIYVNNRTEGLIPVKIVTEEYSAGEINVDDSINSDDTEEFMAEITKRIKRLPPNLKDLAKVNILAHITELELQQSAQYR